MTVTKIGGDGRRQGALVWCVWFQGANKMTESFPPEALELDTGPTIG